MSDLHYFRPDWIISTSEKYAVDLCIYGATSAGVMAAVEAASRGLSVALLQPGKFIGGLTTGGLGETDFGKKHVIGGRAGAFYQDLGKEYGRAEEWKFEPHVAAKVYDRYLSEARVTPLLCQYLDGVEVVAGEIKSIRLLGGRTVSAKVFMDCSYEGDLMAKAGVPYHVGREPNSKYGETINGIQVREHHQFLPAGPDPYVKEGDASSGLLPGVEAVDLSKHHGEGDKRLQAYCFRICMTDDPALRIPWEKPAEYDPRQYVLADRWFNGPKDEYNEQILPGPIIRKFDVLTNPTKGGHRKTDTNNHGPVSSDFIGQNWEWPDACFEARETIYQAHVTYQKGYYWHLANSPTIPQQYRDVYSQWGLAKDEFTTCGGWSPTLYIREARRMVGDYVVTEADTSWKRKCEDPVGMGSYNLDSHNCTRFVNARGQVQNEGDVQLPPAGPYGISHRAVVPPRGSIRNLLVPVACSTSHIAYGSVRMEPVFMILGQSAAVAAHLCLQRGVAVQELPYEALRAELDKGGQITAL